MDEHVAPQSGRAAGPAPLQRDEPETAYVFVSERKAPLTTDAVRKIVSRAGRQAGIAFPVHPRMLRHATGYKLANDGQDTRAIQLYLGHRHRVGSGNDYLLQPSTPRRRHDGYERQPSRCNRHDLSMPNAGWSGVA